MTSLLGAIAVGLLASAWHVAALGEPVWSLEAGFVRSFGLIAGAYFAADLLNRWQGERGSAGALQAFVMALLTTVAGVSSAIVLLGLRNVELSKQTIVCTLGSAMLVATLGFASRRKAGVQSGLFALLIAAGLAFNFAAGAGAFLEPRPVNPVEYIASHHYGIEATHYALPEVIKPGDGIPIPPRGYRIEPGGGIREGGGIVALSTGYLLASGAGGFYLFDRPAPETAIETRQLSIQVPINSAAFREAVGGDTAVRYWNFRVQDVEVQSTDTGLRVFASHHYWHADRACYVVRVSSLETSTPDLATVDGVGEWKTIFESRPCLAIKTFARGQRFAGEESGGKLGLLGDATLLVTLGDHEHDGLNSQTMLAQDPEASYGKIISIDLPTGRAEPFSVGHRNPQGLFITHDQQVWSTEHGPEGGDELNRIERGSNYGWPVATYGVDYGLNVWPLTATGGSHAGYREPIYAWVPSIGVSNLVGVETSAFEIWRGDFLVGSLRDRGLWRMRIRNGGLVVNERIEIGIRIRDVIEGHGGEIVLWSDEAPEIVFLEATDERKTPEAAFALCRGCHAIADETSSIGPNLRGVVGREIGSAEGYVYSHALSRRSGRWTEATLDEYLTEPQAFAPGTSMGLPGMQNAQERRLVIEYLKAL